MPLAPTVETFYGLIRFDTPIECTRDALGSRAAVVIGGVSGVLELPSQALWGTEVPEDPLHMPLVPPTAALTWKEGDAPMWWGRPIRYPEGWSSVEKALLTFELPPDKMSAQATSVHKGFARWYKLFVQYFELVTKQRSLSLVEAEPYPGQLDLFRWSSAGKPDRPYDREPHRATIYASRTDELLLKPFQFDEICALAASSKEPALHYRIQLEAYRAMRNGDYRKAIIETGTAAELGLVRAAMEVMSKSGITFVDDLVKRFPALGGKLELARMVGVALPSTDYQGRLVTPRNGVIHRGAFAGRGTALDALQVTDELLRRIFPSLQDT